MTKKISSLIKKCENIKPLDGRVLIAPMKLRTYKAEGYETTADEVEGNLVTDEAINETPHMKVSKTNEVNYNYRYQKAVVLQVPEGEVRFAIGDTIVYDLHSPAPFDLIKGVEMIRNHMIIAKVTE